MAFAVAARDEDHARWRDFRHVDGIVPRPAGHPPEGDAPGVAGGDQRVDDFR